MTSDSLYQAALPGYTANFSRDSLTYGLLADDHYALRAQLAFSARHQGSRSDPDTGEEPGKVHHELPGVLMRGRLTTYNACDTTALFVIALDRLARRGDAGIVSHYREHLDRALEYFSAHLYDDVFHEDLAQSGADRFALKVTYWKDSELNVAGSDREPSYPIAYSLVHFQVKSALQAAAQLMQSPDLAQQAQTMIRRGFETFWRDDHFAVAVEGDGTVIDAPSSDSLHSLLFLRPDEVPQAAAKHIVEYSTQLETRVGYRPALAQMPGQDDYHTRWVWVHEQALLHAAARRHGLDHAAQVASRIIPTLDQSFPELIDPDTGQLGGNPTQLWSVGAHVYFQRVRVAGTLVSLVEKLEGKGSTCA